jgi:Flp pilus assembly protein TadD
MNRLSHRDRVLLLLLALLAAAWLVTIPWRAKLGRETAKIERETAAQSAAVRELEKMRGEEKAARRRVDDAPGSVRARLDLAAVLGRQRRYDDAAKEVRTALALDPENGEAHRALGEIQDVTGLSDLAMAEFRRALELDPRDNRALTLLAYKYVAFGWNSRAEKLLARAVKESPDDSRLHVTLGLVHFQMSDFSAAERELLMAQRLAPDDPSIIGPLIDIYRHANRYEEALRAIEHGLKVLPQKEVLLTERARIYYETQEPQKAVQSADEVLAKHPDEQAALYLRGAALKRLGRVEEAIRDLERVRAKDPRTEQTLLQLGQLYIQKGDMARGRQLLEQHKQFQEVSDTLSRLSLVVASKPDDARAHFDLGSYYLRGQSYTRAIVELKRTLELRPNDVAARRLLAQALAGAGRKAEAQAAVAGLSNGPDRSTTNP